VTPPSRDPDSRDPESHDPDHLAADLALAHALADAADRLTLARFGALDLHVETKPDLTPVSDADRDAERALRDILGRERPADAVHGEEFGITGSATRLWVLDPIDGTKNFVRGVPVWATLVALVVDGAPVVGVVSAPALGRRWWGASGLGAWVREPGAEEPRRLEVSGVAVLGDASLAYSDLVGWGDRAAPFRDLLDAVWRTRAYGDFWSHMLVAEGAVDIAIEPELSPWDIAALVPVIEEAGGEVTGWDGSPAMQTGTAVTSNRVLHPALLDALG